MSFTYPVTPFGTPPTFRWPRVPSRSACSPAMLTRRRPQLTVSGLVPGAYYLVLRVDKEGKVTEHNRANNETAVAIELAAPDPVARGH